MGTRTSNLFFFFFNDTATTEIYTLSLHDALPTSPLQWYGDRAERRRTALLHQKRPGGTDPRRRIARTADQIGEHTSELQSPCNLVCRLLLEKKKRRSSTRAGRLPTRCSSRCYSAQ